MTVWYDTTAVFGDGDVVLRTVVVRVCVHVVLRGAAVCQWCCTNRMTHGGHHCSLDVCNGGVGSVSVSDSPLGFSGNGLWFQSMRENKEKQALGDLMIKPVQRIPRYELLVKDLLKHTPEDHPDHPFLLDAQKNIKQLAEKINKGRRNAEEVERETRVMQEIEAHIEGVEHILNPQRKFLRQEMVMEAKSVGGKKDRSLFLFTDLLICTTLKRKSGSLRRSSMSLYTAASVIDTSSKYKFLWKLPLEDVELVKGSNQATNRDAIQKTISRLDEDLSTLGQISKLSETLSFPHQSLDDVIKDLMASVHRELAEKQSLAFSMTFLPTKLELTTASAESTFVFEFSSPDARSNFEQAFEEAKKKLAMNKDQWDPEFLKAIPIMKTRSGMQFSCASPSHSCPENTYEVWVCNSDGYVGQVCLLNIRDEPTVEACIAVCSARIICIAAVPGLKSRSVYNSQHAPYLWWCYGVRMVEQCYGVRMVEQWCGVRMVEWWCGVRMVERWCEVRMVERWCGVRMVERWCGVRMVKRWCGVRMVERCCGVRMVEWCYGVRMMERWCGVRMMERWCGVRMVERWCGVRMVERWCGVRMVERWCGVRMVERWCGVRMVERWCGVRMMERWCEMRMMEGWCGVRMVERWCGVRMVERWCGVRMVEWWCGVRMVKRWCGVRMVERWCGVRMVERWCGVRMVERWCGDDGAVVWSENGGVVVWSEDGGAVVWSEDGGAVVWSEDGGAVVWSEDDGAVVWSEDGGAVVWSEDDGAVVWSEDGGAVVWSEDGGAVVWSEDGRAVVWSEDDGAVVWSEDDGAVVWSEDGGAVVWSEDDGAVVWSEDDGAVVWSEDDGAVVWSEDGGAVV
ncbi:hypothetical protein NFI96_006837 [Prochilodus magdalenae]|nr:hypothetical protein NFI96_006837 [Prochilodus magdalenae]